MEFDPRSIYRSLRSWCESAFRFGPEVEQSIFFDEEEEKTYVQLYTFTNAYSIVGYFDENVQEPILICTSTTRKPRPGEHWHRSRELRRGPLSRETFFSILSDIVSFECVKPARSAEYVVTKQKRRR